MLRRAGESAVLNFPGYHQVDCVRKLNVYAEDGQGCAISSSIQQGAERASPSLGSPTISRLCTATRTQRVFDSIVVITDRRVLDRQLQRTMRQFEQTLGVVENIDTTSRQLKEALESGKTIIVTTLQKFPVIVNQIGELPGQAFRCDCGPSPFLAIRGKHQEPQVRAARRILWKKPKGRGDGSNARGGTRRHHPGSYGAAGLAAQRLDVRIYGDTKT